MSRRYKSRILAPAPLALIARELDDVIEWPRRPCPDYPDYMTFGRHPQKSMKVRSHALRPYGDDWAASVRAAMQNLSKMISERQKQELRITLLEILVIELKATVHRLQSCENKVAAINTFAPEAYDVLKPIIISLYTSDGGYTAAWHDANIHSSGENEDEAINSLKSLILDCLDNYSKEPAEKLGPEPTRQLVIIKQFVRKTA